jgi:hypothetical protein
MRPNPSTLGEGLDASTQLVLVLRIQRHARGLLARARLGLGRIVSFVPPFIRLTPDSLTYSVPLLLKRQCDRTLGAARYPAGEEATAGPGEGARERRPGTLGARAAAGGAVRRRPAVPPTLGHTGPSG